ncbi:uncharacterized protein F5Z01DRAFT_671125 [Emericellopsis atlantica]|uniref:Uncharacterized protein n=1 Tax=Emericellopsis atlantica TaxID=2614577 RepID=A0A9P7ZSJ6_9HYPO|nr:uncharacterized protein F5Z01DRAFT_671125 [Emericellopsis atlantica]KAG9257529.1 hypothetical protein F5Z01DRAFT_671125 [Emericellopsis atlantica]
MSSSVHEDVGDESELSEPGSIENSPPLNLARHNRRRNAHSSYILKDDMDEDEDEEASVVKSPSRVAKRKRASTNGEATLKASDDTAQTLTPTRMTTRPKSRTGRPSLGKSYRAHSNSNKGVVLGHWRDSGVPDEDRKHAVIGFIDVRDRLRTRIQSYNLKGEAVANIWPLPHKTGGSWVIFEGIWFLPHLVGMDQLQVKEYVRLRIDAHEDTEEERKAAELAAKKEAIQVVKMKEASSTEPPTYPYPPPLIAYGANPPDTKRRRTNTDLNPTTSAPEPPAHTRAGLDPLEGTRPTRIFLGCWSKSDAERPEDRHAVYGILGGNDMFRVKLVRETRTGEYRNGNFPQGAGALWIPYEEVDFEPHLKSLTRNEVKEYVRIRQYQIDHGETEEERIDHETQAVYRAQARVMALRSVQNHPVEDVGQTTAADATAGTGTPTNGATSSTEVHSGAEGVRTSRRVEARHQQQQEQEQQRKVLEQQQSEALEQQQSEQQQAFGQQRASEHMARQALAVAQQHQPQRRETVSARQSLPAGHGRQSLPSGLALPPSGHFGPLQRATTLAQREVARAEATQGRADAQVTHRQRAQVAADEAASAAAAAAAAAAASSSPGSRASSTFQQNSEVQRLNSVWARQESMRARAGAEDVKVYDNIKYERKHHGPFFGKLVSPGNLINIDGEDYVEYRVLTKPSFY